MDIVYLKKLVKIVEQSIIDEIEVEEEGLHVRIAKKSHQNPAYVHTVPSIVPLQAVSSDSGRQKAEQVTATPQPESTKPEVKCHEVKSPIVGTFYRAPSPDADPYVEVGAIVQSKQVLCIIEAMKLMNEVESDVSGRVVKILVDNAQPVEYNQPLFLIEPV